MTVEQIKLINDVASSVACTIADSNISIDIMGRHLRDYLKVPSEVVEHCITIVTRARTEIELNK